MPRDDPESETIRLGVAVGSSSRRVSCCQLIASGVLVVMLGGVAIPAQAAVPSLPDTHPVDQVPLPPVVPPVTIPLPPVTVPGVPSVPNPGVTPGVPPAGAVGGSTSGGAGPGGAAAGVGGQRGGSGPAAAPASSSPASPGRPSQSADPWVRARAAQRRAYERRLR